MKTLAIEYNEKKKREAVTWKTIFNRKATIANYFFCLMSAKNVIHVRCIHLVMQLLLHCYVQLLCYDTFYSGIFPIKIYCLLSLKVSSFLEWLNEQLFVYYFTLLCEVDTPQPTCSLWSEWRTEVSLSILIAIWSFELFVRILSLWNWALIKLYVAIVW